MVIFLAALVGNAIAEPQPQLLPTPAPAPAPISPLQCTTPPIQCCNEVGPVSYGTLVQASVFLIEVNYMIAGTPCEHSRSRP